METKLHKTLCKVVHSLANLMILFLIFLMAFIAVCCAISTLFDFSVWALIATIVCTAVWMFLLKVKEAR